MRMWLRAQRSEMCVSGDDDGGGEDGKGGFVEVEVEANGRGSSRDTEEAVEEGSEVVM